MSKSYVSPKGDVIVAVLESVPIHAYIKGINDDGSPDYSHENSKTFWDDQDTVMREGKYVYVCEDGEHWTLDQLKVDDSDDGDEDSDDDEEESEDEVA